MRISADRRCQRLARNRRRARRRRRFLSEMHSEFCRCRAKRAVVTSEGRRRLALKAVAPVASSAQGKLVFMPEMKRPSDKRRSIARQWRPNQWAGAALPWHGLAEQPHGKSSITCIGSKKTGVRLRLRNRRVTRRMAPWQYIHGRQLARSPKKANGVARAHVVLNHQ